MTSPCVKCPFGPNSKGFWKDDRIQRGLQQIKELTDRGELVGPQVCHLIAGQRPKHLQSMIPFNDEEICVGHKLLLEKQSS
jgi:hypothetical protein